MLHGKARTTLRRSSRKPANELDQPPSSWMRWQGPTRWICDVDCVRQTPPRCSDLTHTRPLLCADWSDVRRSSRLEWQVEQSLLLAGVERLSLLEGQLEQQARAEEMSARAARAEASLQQAQGAAQQAVQEAAEQAEARAAAEARAHAAEVRARAAEARAQELESLPAAATEAARVVAEARVRQLQRDLLLTLTQLRLSDVVRRPRQHRTANGAAVDACGLSTFFAAHVAHDATGLDLGDSPLPRVSPRLQALGTLLDAPRLAMPLTQLVFGDQQDVTRGIDVFVRPERGGRQYVREGINGGVDAIRQEVEALGDPEVSLCLRYILEQEAGANPTIFHNGGQMMDCDEYGRLLDCRRRADGRGMVLADFVNHYNSRTARLEEADVVALRLYTTAAFRAINNPLREQARRPPGERRNHPLAITVARIYNAALWLRTVEAQGTDAHRQETLYRGLCDAEIPQQFLERGGTEFAPMSFTRNLDTAIAFSTNHGGGASCSTVLRVQTAGAIQRGANVTYLSCFPGEREALYPPLTYLRPAHRSDVVPIASSGIQVQVVDVTFER